MKDIQVDENGDLRCAECGGKHFQDRRTTRAHVIGWTTVGVGALATRKKLRCKLCGAYNKQGNAQPYKPATTKPAPVRDAQQDARRQMEANKAQREARAKERKMGAPTPSRAGQFLTVKKPGPKTGPPTSG